MKTKICTKCGEEKPAILDFFHKSGNGRGLYGLYSICKVCKNAQHREWLKNNTDQQKEYHKNYKDENPEKRKKWKKEWDLNNQPHIKQYREDPNNKERDKKKVAAWTKIDKAKNPQKYKNRKLEWDKNNQEYIKEYRQALKTKKLKSLSKKLRSKKLVDSIVIERLCCHCNLTSIDIQEYPELIKTERIRLKLYRKSNV